MAIQAIGANGQDQRPALMFVLAPLIQKMLDDAQDDPDIANGVVSKAIAAKALGLPSPFAGKKA